MASDQDRDLRRLAKRFRIAFHPQISPDQWPSKHKVTFENIRNIGNQAFDSYCASVDIHSDEQPWKQRTKHRATWLAARTARLLDQDRNEAGWRFALENDVLLRFAVEVACPKCRARIWRSEIEASMSQSNDVARDLEKRKHNRKSCQCGPGNRPQDYYEIGINPLFDDRVQEVILHDPLLKAELPKQEPDRVFGLKRTRNMENLLLETMANPPGGSQGCVGDCIRSSAFKEGIEPLLFPFLVLEAKSEKSPNGFMDIQTQTMFPILALLKLQEDLQNTTIGSAEDEVGSLVWFLANRGDSWRVYGCFVSVAGGEPPRYDIVQLWDGCTSSTNGALQLLLIVDYIFDWARDIYRPSVLRHLKALATGQAYDEVSFANDSDIFSLRGSIQGDVSSWIPPPPSNIPPGTQDPLRNLNNLSPNTKLGTLRSASVVQSRVVGLYLEEQSVRSLMELAGTAKQQPDFSQSEARILINFITQWNDLIVLSERDLASLEELWTECTPPEFKTSALGEGDTIYAMLEFASYITPSWEIVREITYLAISKPAFNVLVKHAAYTKRHHGINALPEITRPCSGDILHDAVTCLRSGSPSQALLAAATCTSFALYSLPNRQRPDYAPPTEDLAFGRIRHSRLRSVISRFRRISELTRPRKMKVNPKLSVEVNARINEERDRAIQECRDISLIRITENRNNISKEPPHEVDSCARCHRLGQSIDANQIRKADHIQLSVNGVALMESLNLESDPQAMHDVCLFVIDGYTMIDGQLAMAGVIEDLLQCRKLYHTIRHPIPRAFNGGRIKWYDTIWNLPLPLRPPTVKQRRHVSDWICEIRGEDMSIRGDDMLVREKPWQQLQELWNKLQLTLYFLNEGLTWETATQNVKDFVSSGQNQPHNSLELQGDRQKLYSKNDFEKRKARKAAGEYGDQGAWALKYQAPKFGVGDANVREYHSSPFSADI